ncbi:hypothetical protein SNEBB_002293, partial [Seison nebaliae]
MELLYIYLALLHSSLVASQQIFFPASDTRETVVNCDEVKEYYLECVSRGRNMILPPDFDYIDSKTTKILSDIKYYGYTKGETQFITEITFINPRPEFTGNYECFDYKFNDKKRINLYFFTHDVLIVPIPPVYRYLSRVDKDEEVYVSCVKAHPNVKVEIFTDHVIPSKYIEQKGLLVKSENFRGVQQFQCRATLRDETTGQIHDESQTIFIAHGSGDVMGFPRLSSLTIKEVQGNNFSITCTISSSINNVIILNWQSSTGKLLYNVSTISNDVGGGKVVTNQLFVSDAQSSDSGNYTCTAKLNDRETSTTANVQIIEDSISLFPIEDIQTKFYHQTNLTVNGTYGEEARAQFRVVCTPLCFNNLVSVVYVEDSEKRMESSYESYKFSIDDEEVGYTILLTITVYNLTFATMGTYVAKFQNNERKLDVPIFFYCHSPPILTSLKVMEHHHNDIKSTIDGDSLAIPLYHFFPELEEKIKNRVNIAFLLPNVPYIVAHTVMSYPVKEYDVMLESSHVGQLTSDAAVYRRIDKAEPRIILGNIRVELVSINETMSKNVRRKIRRFRRKIHESELEITKYVKVEFVGDPHTPYNWMRQYRLWIKPENSSAFLTFLILAENNYGLGLSLASQQPFVCGYPEKVTCSSNSYFFNNETTLQPPQLSDKRQADKSTSMTVYSEMDVKVTCSMSHEKPMSKYAGRYECSTGISKEIKAILKGFLADHMNVDVLDDILEHRVKEIREIGLFLPETPKLLPINVTQYVNFTSWKKEFLKQKITNDFDKTFTDRIISKVNMDKSISGHKNTKIENININMEAEESVKLTCALSGGRPLPQVIWYKNGKRFDRNKLSSRSGHMKLGKVYHKSLTYDKFSYDGLKEMENINIVRARGDDAGVYTCAVRGIDNTVIGRRFNMKVNDALQNKYKKTLLATLIPICLLLIGVIIITVLFCRARRENRNLKKMLEAKGKFDPNLPLNLQPDALEYDSNIEI